MQPAKRVSASLPMTETPITREAIVRARRSLGHSQGRAAEVLGVSRSTVSHWEQGVQLPVNWYLKARLTRYIQKANRREPPEGG